MHISDITNPTENITANIITAEHQFVNGLINLEHQIFNVSNYRNIFVINDTESTIMYIVLFLGFLGILPCIFQKIACKIIQTPPIMVYKLFKCCRCYKRKDPFYKLDTLEKKENKKENDKEQKLITA